MSRNYYTKLCRGKCGNYRDIGVSKNIKSETSYAKLHLRNAPFLLYKGSDLVK